MMGDCYDKMEGFSLKGDIHWETAMTRWSSLKGDIHWETAMTRWSSLNGDI